MERNYYIEKLLSLCSLSYILWYGDQKSKEGSQDVPLSIYNKMSDFYQTLDFDNILEQNNICQVESALGVCNLLIPGTNQIYVIGPYLKEKASTAEIFFYLISNNLPISQELEFFYHSIPIFEKTWLNTLYEFLNHELNLSGFQEIKQETSLPYQNHLHSQFFTWNHAEAAFSALISAEGELLAAFNSENQLLMMEAEKNICKP